MHQLYGISALVAVDDRGLALFDAVHEMLHFGRDAVVLVVFGNDLRPLGFAEQLLKYRLGADAESQ